MNIDEGNPLLLHALKNERSERKYKGQGSSRAERLAQHVQRSAVDLAMCVVLLSHFNVTIPKQLPPQYVIIRNLLSRLDKEAKLGKTLISFTRPNQ